MILQPTPQRQLGVTTYGGSYVVNLFKQTVVSQKICICYCDATQQFLCHIDSLNTFTAQIAHSLLYWRKICLHSLTDQNSIPFTKNVQNSRKSNL